MFLVLRLLSSYIFILLWFYIALAEDLIDCPGGEQGDKEEQRIFCNASTNASKVQDCAFIFALSFGEDKFISCIKIINQGNDTDFGYPQIDLGGVNNTYIVGDVFSQPGRGVNYILKVWKKPNDISTTTLPPTTTTVETTTIDMETTTSKIPTTEKIETTTNSGRDNKFSKIFLVLYLLNFVF